ncbi:glycosyltransferase [Peribacillus kribbensis]|uniref:glycosyltransferase n=1 Tax=Peribacillus kribbensis TaxID=356658 RepID=UPI000429B45E|nr:glycosyltransferase [Peribacillus kribbensis]
MKKNLLFVIPGLSAGGGEKSLVSLLNQLDFNLYNVDLFLLNHDGIFMDLIPREVNILPLPKDYKIFSMPFHKSIFKFLIHGRILLSYYRTLFSVNNKKTKNESLKEQDNWKYLSKALSCLDKNYDVAVGFLEKTSTYFCVEKVKADKKIGWVHIDYNKLGMDPNYDIRYFNKLNHIVTVSEECANILREKFPTEQNKVRVIHNIVSPAAIKMMADENSSNVFNKKSNEIIILSIGRLHYQKGFELAIGACKNLVELGYKIKWHVIGEGEERTKLTGLINKYNLQDHFILLGVKPNPYPYIKQADIFVMTSRFEGKSIAIDEAKILNKPIVVTNYPTARDQLQTGIDGLIVDMDPKDISKGIEKLIKEKSYREQIISALATQHLGTEDEIKKFYQII